MEKGSNSMRFLENAGLEPNEEPTEERLDKDQLHEGSEEVSVVDSRGVGRTNEGDRGIDLENMPTSAGQNNSEGDQNG